MTPLSVLASPCFLKIICIFPIQIWSVGATNVYELRLACSTQHPEWYRVVEYNSAALKQGHQAFSCTGDGLYPPYVLRSNVVGLCSAFACALQPHQVVY